MVMSSLRQQAQADLQPEKDTLVPTKWLWVCGGKMTSLDDVAKPEISVFCGLESR
jgi:hypothetical protein